MPVAAAQWVLGADLPPMLVLLMIVLIYLVLGCVMDSLSMLLLTIPIFLPIVLGLDFWGLGQHRQGHLVRHPGADGGGDRPDHPPPWA